MSMTCTICRHSDRKSIELALIRGDSLRDIALQHKTSKDAVQRHRRCIMEMYERVSLAGDTSRVLNLRAELNRAIADVKTVREAALNMLKDPRHTSRLNLSRKNALDAAKLLLQASDRLDKHLRMLGDLTGEFKQPQRNPRNITERLYNEWVDLFVEICKPIDPNIERRSVIDALSRMPETAGDFMPFIDAELARDSYLN